MVTIRAQLLADAIDVITELLETYVQKRAENGTPQDQQKIRELEELWDLISEAIEE